MSIVNGSVALLVIAIFCFLLLAALCWAADRDEQILNTEPTDTEHEETDL